jgi:hypothetical protein
MIRDPSDGSVREKAQFENVDDDAMRAAKNPTCQENLQVDSGLPIGSKNPEQIARLERSRTWLKEYHKPKSEGQ